MSGAFEWIDWGADASVYDLLGIAGIIIAIIQLFRSRSALVAAKNSLINTKKRLATIQALDAMPVLHLASRSINESILADGERSTADAHLATFAHTASTVSQLIKISDPDETDLARAFFEAAATASQGRSNLYWNVNDEIPLGDLIGDPADALREFLGAIHGPMTKFSHGSIRTTTKRRPHGEHEPA